MDRLSVSKLEAQRFNPKKVKEVEIREEEGIAGTTVGLEKILEGVSKFQMSAGNLNKDMTPADISGTKGGNI